MSDYQIDQQIFDELFRKYRKTALVYLKAVKSKGDNFDPFRDTGYDEVSKNPLPVKVLTHTISPTSLVYREMGVTEAGAIQIIVHDRDVTLIQNSDKISIDGKDYYVYSDSVGNKFQIFPTQFAKYAKIVLFKKDIG